MKQGLDKRTKNNEALAESAVAEVGEEESPQNDKEPQESNCEEETPTEVTDPTKLMTTGDEEAYHTYRGFLLSQNAPTTMTQLEAATPELPAHPLSIATAASDGTNVVPQV